MPLPRWRAGDPRIERWIAAVALVAIVAVAVWLVRIRDASPSPQTLNVYCFSAMEPVLRDAILPAFRRDWEARTGLPPQLIVAYAGSGTITDRIVREFPAGMAILASEIDAERLRQRGMLSRSWRRQPHHGVVARSPIVIGVRAGDALDVTAVADLERPGLALVLPDPQTSGLGEWTTLLVWDDARWRHRDEEPAFAEARSEDSVRATWANAVQRPASAGEAVAQFADGSGEATVGYESGLAALPGVGVIYPPRSLVAEHVVVTIDRNVRPEQRALLDALVAFLWSDEAQRALVDHGFRSVDDALNGAFPRLDRPHTLADLGSLEEVTAVVRRLTPSRS